MPTWTIANTVVDGLLQESTPSWEFGEEITLEWWLSTPTSGTYGSTTYGTTGYGGSSVESRYHDLLQYIRDASLASTNVYQTRGWPQYEERLPEMTSVGSLVVAVQPGPDVLDTDAVWALLVDGRDTSRPITGNRSLELTLVPLAPLEEYATKSAVEESLGTGVL